MERLERDFGSYPRITSLDPDIAYEVFRDIGISPIYDDDVRIFEQKDGMFLIHYIHPVPEVKHVKGIVYRYSKRWADERVLCISFPWTMDIVYNPEQKLAYDFTKYHCSVAEEGTVLRIFNDQIEGNSKWHISTHKHIDGDVNKWAGPTFGELFYSIWGDVPFDSVLIPSYCYVFLLSHPKNRIGANIEKPKLLIAAIFTKDFSDFFRRDMKAPYALLKKLQNPLIELPKVLNISSQDDLERELENLPPSASGILMVSKTNEKECIKIMSGNYEKKLKARGENDPNPLHRFAELLFAKNVQDQKELRAIFANLTDKFDQLEDLYRQFFPLVQTAFADRYVNRIFKPLPKDIHRFITKVHTSYDSTKNIAQNLHSKAEHLNGKVLNDLLHGLKSMINGQTNASPKHKNGHGKELKKALSGIVPDSAMQHL